MMSTCTLSVGGFPGQARRRAVFWLSEYLVSILPSVDSRKNI